MHPTQSLPSLPRRWLFGAPILALLVIATVVAAVTTDKDLQETVGFLAMLLGLTASSTFMFRRSKLLEKRERGVWRAFATALALAAIGVAATGVWDIVAGGAPAFGPIDSLFLAGYAMVAVTLLRLARSDPDGTSWSITLLDAIVGAIALSALVWSAFFHDLVLSMDGVEGWEIIVGLTYPILDIAMIVAVMILVIRRSNYHFDIRLVFFGIGMSFQVMADFIYFSRGVDRSFAEAQPAWPLFILATIFWLAAAVVLDRTPAKREFPDGTTPAWALIWPYLLAGALLWTHVVRYSTAGSEPDDVFLLDALLLIGLVVIMRQVVQIRRDRQRVEAQRTELVSSVSHELRTPLTALVGYLMILDDEGDDFALSVQREMISEATSQAQHISRLVSDLVMLSRGDRYQLPLQVARADLQSVVMSSLRNVESEGALIDQEVAEYVEVGVDADRVQQAITNLVNNAARYGNGRILVVAGSVQNDLVIEVHDNGPGIPVKYESAIWKRFERGAHRLDASAPGLGIGLAIVQAVALSHGGYAEHEPSKRLGGACFRLVIPGCVVEGGASKEPASKPPSGLGKASQALQITRERLPIKR